MKKNKVQVYRNRRNKRWYWRLRAKNGQVMNWPGQGFARQGAALKNFQRVRAIFEGEVEIEVLK